jgi:hypothetical protein
VTFNEKVQWRKFHDRNPLFTTLADKLLVKTHIKRIIPELTIPRVLWSGNSLKSVDFYNFPDDYVIKANHASGTNFIVRNGEHPSVEKLSFLEKEWRATDISKTFVEWAYAQISILFFIEEFLNFEDASPIDYKFWVFHGEVKFVQVDLNRFTEHKRAFYSTSGVKLEFLLTHPDINEPFQMPNNFDEMIWIAEKISEGLDFIRVDLYSDNEAVYFGECTMYPGGGYEKFTPFDFDEKIGKLWCLNNRKPISN